MECSICMEKEELYYTECNHSYCIQCLSKITKCAMCRKLLVRPLLCSEIKNNNKEEYEDDDSSLNLLPTSTQPPSPLLRLVERGAWEVYITPPPKITFYKVKYIRHTKFQGYEKNNKKQPKNNDLKKNKMYR